MPLFALLVSEQSQYCLLWSLCFDKIRLQLAIEMGQNPTFTKVWLGKAVSQKRNLAETAMSVTSVVYVSPVEQSDCVPGACATAKGHGCSTSLLVLA